MWIALAGIGPALPTGAVLAAQRSSVVRCDPKSNKKSQLNAEQIARLVDKARLERTVRVIVGLCVDFAPEGTLPGNREVQKQRRAITRAQDALIKKMSRHKVTGVKKYSFVPFMAITVDGAALSFLNSSALVATIEVDEAVPAAPYD